jgi:hypothetical protein
MMQFAISVLLAIGFALPVVQSQTKSALESDASGWKDLFADKTMKDWIRGPLGAAGKLRAGSMEEASPWKMDAATGILLCEGDKVGHEWMRYATELADGVLHVEWRLTKVDGEPAYNSGVYVRSSADGTVWHQAQGTLAGGFLFGATPVNGAPQRFNLQKSMTENRVKPAGEWNIYEIRMQGKQIMLWVNGAVVSEYGECGMPRGFIGLEAEGFRVEYRNVKYKAIE